MSTSLQANSYSSAGARVSVRMRLVVWSLLALGLSVMVCGVGYAENEPNPADPQLIEEFVDFQGRTFLFKPLEMNRQRGPTTEIVDPATAAIQFIQTEGYRFGVYSLSQLSEQPVIRHEASDDSTSVIFSQSHMGLHVVGGELRVNVVGDVGRVARFAVGKIATALPVDVTAIFPADAALDKAVMLWQESQGTIEIPVASIPTLELLALGILDNTPSTETPLVWTVHVADEPSNTAITFYISAQNGEVVRTQNNVRHSEEEFPYPAPPISRKVYNCAMTTTWNCDLSNYGRAEGQLVDEGPNPFEFGYGEDDVDKTFENVKKSHDYWGMKFNLNGANGYGGIGNYALNRTKTSVRTYVDRSWAECPKNASFNGPAGYINLCLNTHDIDEIGHEYTHAVQYSTILNGGQPSGFQNSGQSGAISEGMADIFAMAVSHKENDLDWILFDRDISDPSSILDDHQDMNVTYPNSTYDSSYYCGAIDGGGIHHNSTVVGGAAANMVLGDDLNGCFIHPISFHNVQRIYYHALALYLTRTASFLELYDAVWFSCLDLYGPTLDPITGKPICDTVKDALQAAMLNQPGKCANPAVLAQAPPCARPAFDIYPANSAGIPTSEFYMPFEIRLRGDGVEGREVNVYITEFREDWADWPEDVLLLPLRNDPRFRLIGVGNPDPAYLQVPNSKPYDWREQFNWRLLTADQLGVGKYNVIVDNGNNVFNATDDSVTAIEVKQLPPQPPCGSNAFLSLKQRQNCVAKPVASNVTPVMN